MKCTNCCRVLEDEEDIRYAFDNPYCESCYDNTFSYCERCDSIMYSDIARYNQEGYPYCSYCWEEVEGDKECPNNPSVFTSDRSLIVNLSRGWLKGDIVKKKIIKIKRNDFRLFEIREIAGLVDKSLYLYGLRDRDEYQIKATPDIMERTKEFFKNKGVDLEYSEDCGVSRLGISRSLRENNIEQITELIRELTIC